MSRDTEGKKVLFIPDTHVPYHDKRAFDLVLRVASTWKPDVCVVLGDFADMYSVSSHSRDPRRKLTLADELEETRDALNQLTDAVGSARRIFVEGNHEWRLERYLRDKAPELSGLSGVSFRDIVVKPLGWEWVPYMDHLKLGKVYVTHEVGFAGPTAIQKTGAAYAASVVFGHCHRLGSSYFGDVTGRTHVAAAMGWLGDRRNIGYGHEASKARDWQLGFGTGRMLANGEMHLQPVPIVGYKCVVEGRFFT